MAGLLVYLEVGTRRTFAGALDWPGWCRSARDPDAAVEALLEYRDRYRAAVGRRLPAGDVEIVERLEGDASTDFGVPGAVPAFDSEPLDGKGLKRQVELLRACWSGFDAAARAAEGVELRKGPRGGGRDLDKIRDHVWEADGAYLRALGGRDPGGDGLREAIVDMLGARARGEPLPPSRRRTPPWPPRYMVQRSAWHALDHAWEIEDRAR